MNDIKKDVVMFNMLYKTGKLIGLTPLFVDNRGFRRNLSKGYSVFLILIFTILTVYSFYSRFNLYKNVSAPQVFLDSAECFCEYCFVIACFYENGFKTENWRRFLQDLRDFEEIMNQTKFTVSKSILLMCLEIFCYHLGITLIHVVENVLWVEENNVDLTYMYISFRIVMYLQFFVLLSVCCIVRIMQRRYHFLNKQLIEIFKFIHNDSDMLQGIQELYSMHRKLYYLAERFNVVYGWQIFFILISTVLSLLNSANFVFLTKNNDDTAEFSLGPYVIYITAYPVFYACSTTALTLACETAKRNAIGMSTLLFRRLPYFTGSRSIRRELMSVAKSAKELIPTFSAGGFYQVNQYLLSSLFSTVTMYLIVIVQLSLSTQSGNSP